MWIYAVALGVIFANLNPAFIFRCHLVMFCVIITDFWWDISSSYMIRGRSAFLWIFQKTSIKSIRFRRLRRSHAKPPCCRFNQPLSKFHCFFAWCAVFKVATSFCFFFSCFSQLIVHLRNLFLLRASVVQMLLTLKDVKVAKSRRKDVKSPFSTWPLDWRPYDELMSSRASCHHLRHSDIAGLLPHHSYLGVRNPFYLNPSGS